MCIVYITLKVFSVHTLRFQTLKTMWRFTPRLPGFHWSLPSVCGAGDDLGNRSFICTCHGAPYLFARPWGFQVGKGGRRGGWLVVTWAIFVVHFSHLTMGGGRDRVVFDSLEELLLLLTLCVSLVCNDVTVGYIWWYLLMFLGIIVVTVLAICRSWCSSCTDVFDNLSSFFSLSVRY